MKNVKDSLNQRILDTITPTDPVDLHQKREERLKLEKEAYEKKRTYREYLQICEETKDDPAARLGWEKVFAAAHDRGDFKYPHEMTRKEFQDFCTENGKPGPVYSEREFQALLEVDLYTDQGKHKYKVTAEHLKRAYLEGRVLHSQLYKNVARQAGFRGEIPEQEAEHTQRVYKQMETFLEAQEKVIEAKNRLEALDRKSKSGEKLDEDLSVIAVYLDKAIKHVNQKCSEHFPTNKLEFYNDLVETHQEAGQLLRERAKRLNPSVVERLKYSS